jgi:N-acetylglucosaminyldiphosphoundecaprenol N-acetyl-beta-D-mannosaminyltransferase
METLTLGKIHAHVLTFKEAMSCIAAQLKDKKPGYVVTPNVDHVCLAEHNVLLREAYQKASLSLVDGMPLVWLSRFLGRRLPEKISGSDLVEPLVALAAQEGLKLYVLGGLPGVGERAVQVWKERFPGLCVVGVDAPVWGFEKDSQKSGEVVQKIQAASPDVILVALGCPKQEIWMLQHREQWGHAMAFGIGASIDFVAGMVKRCPSWVSRIGCEWLYRLCQEPRRLAQRYLVRDRAIVGIAWNTWRTQRKGFVG